MNWRRIKLMWQKKFDRRGRSRVTLTAAEKTTPRNHISTWRKAY